MAVGEVALRFVKGFYGVGIEAFDIQRERRMGCRGQFQRG